MLIDTLILLAGLALLALSSDRFVLGACAVAHNLGITPMVVGLTVVALGTSSPEMLVSAMAALQGTPDMALGNVLGSNIANIALVVGASALIMPLLVASETLRREFPMMFVVTAVAWLVCLDGRLNRLDGTLLMALMVLMLFLIVRAARAAARRDPLKREIEAQAPVIMSNLKAAMLLLGGLLIMVAASRMVVYGATNIARALGVSDLVIGLTVVAIGTSLPELAASVSGALRGQPDIAIGNVIGSNMFNLLPVLAIAGLIAPFGVEPVALSRDFPIMVVLSVLMLLMCLGRGGPGRVTRVNGILLLGCFAGYQGMLYVTSVGG
jgi:cation:H+ antiporter